MKYSIDGNQVCCTRYDFINLQESHAGFGNSLEQAFKEFLFTLPSEVRPEVLFPWEISWARQVLNSLTKKDATVLRKKLLLHIFRVEDALNEEMK